ncbi:MAG TPA: galactokinase [Polyangiaceae bacterium]|nr:galactokinase [Polyangiaceae bacterium]
MTNLVPLRHRFRSIYGAEPRLFSAPGRVNLVGDHTDYNDGFVLPIAIERRTFVAAAPRADRNVRVQSIQFPKAGQFDLDRPGPKRQNGWLDYIEGMAQALEARGIKLIGADLLVDSDVPAGAGLSSSAALEMAVGLALCSLAGDDKLTRAELAVAGQTAEHEYVGTMCGIMDQLIAALGQPDHALFIDCRTLEAKPVPFARPDAVVLICDTKVTRELASSEYNRRRAQCQEGVSALKSVLPHVRALRDVSLADLEANASLLTETVFNRCRHVVTENARTLDAARALSESNLVELGRIMVESHRSLQIEYEVSCPELDLCVATATAQPGVYGARMTGGGFGGCTVNVVAEDAVASVSQALSGALERTFGKAPAIFATRASTGAKEHV